MSNVSEPSLKSRLLVDRVRPAYQQVADQLMERILDGSLAAGDRLPREGDLSAAFGVSRSTMREALQLLASLDLIRTERGANGGSFIARLHADQVSDHLATNLRLMSDSAAVSLDQMLEARQILEVPAARLAASRRSDGHLHQMRQAISREKREREREGKFREHRHFHVVLVDASGNDLLKLLNEPVFRILRERFWRPNIPAGYWDVIDRDHLELLHLIEVGDEAGVTHAMRQHLERIRPAYREVDVGGGSVTRPSDLLGGAVNM